VALVGCESEQSLINLVVNTNSGKPYTSVDKPAICFSSNPFFLQNDYLDRSDETDIDHNSGDILWIVLLVRAEQRFKERFRLTERPISPHTLTCEGPSRANDSAPLIGEERQVAPIPVG